MSIVINIGCFIAGAMFGICVLALCVAAGEADKKMGLK